MCFERWQARKRAQELAKSLFNFEIPDTERHPFQQVPVTDEITFVRNDDEHRADVPDSRKKLPPSANKENIPPYPSPDPPKQQRFLYASTMVVQVSNLITFSRTLIKNISCRCKKCAIRT